MTPLELKNIKLSFHGQTALEIEHLELIRPLGIIGGSGSGKSNILNVIAGVEQIECGEIFIYGKEVGDTKIRDRRVSLISPRTPLFKNKSVGRNLVYPLKKRRKSKNEINQALQQISGLLEGELLQSFDKKPSDLSKKGISSLLMARAMIKNPNIILVDQPHAIKGDLPHLLQLLSSSGVFFIIASYDYSLIKDAVEEFVVLRRGEIIFRGNLDQLKNTPNKYIQAMCFPQEFIKLT